MGTPGIAGFGFEKVIHSLRALVPLLRFVPVRAKRASTCRWVCRCICRCICICICIYTRVTDSVTRRVSDSVTVAPSTGSFRGRGALLFDFGARRLMLQVAVDDDAAVVPVDPESGFDELGANLR